jgi:predicted dehydrogenase
LTEKPFVADLVQADRLIAKATENRIQIVIAHLARYAPAFQAMEMMIDAGDIGEVLTCYLRGKEDKRGGGEDMMVLGSHLFDLAVYLFGPPLEVFSDIRTDGRIITSGDIISTDEPIGLTAGDEVMSLYRFPGNINTIFQSHRAVVEGGATRMGIVVAGTKASLAVRYSGDRTLRICKDFPTPEEDESQYETITVPEAPEIPGAEPIDYKQCVSLPAQPHKRYYADNNRRAAWDLLKSLEKGTPLLSSAMDAVWSTEMITGAYRSAIERRVITLPQTERKHPLGE